MKFKSWPYSGASFFKIAPTSGQRQRLMIARAMAASPKVIYFDESTSALDNRSQQIVVENLASRRITRVVIAHRLSTVRQADCVFVMEQGKHV